MSGPFVWVFLPILVGWGLIIFIRRLPHVEFIGAGFSALLAIGTLLLPVGGAISIRGALFQIPTTLTFLRRQFVIPPDMLGVILAVYGAAFLWFAFAGFVKPGKYFVPLGLITVAVFVGSISFRTWEFVGVFMLLAVLLFVIMLSSTEQKPSLGVLNFLTFNVLGVPFLLIAGALISGLASTPPGLSIVARPAIFLGLGFAFMLALFPFHAWMPRLAEEGNPFSTAFVLVFLPAFACILLLQVIDQNVWLRNSDEVFTLLRMIGMVTIIAGGFFAAFQRDLGRILGFSALIETGMFLLAIGAGPRRAASLFFPLILSRSLGFLIWAVGLAEIRKLKGGLKFRAVQGLARKNLLIASAVITGSLSSAGLPLLIGYVPRIRLYATLAPIAPTAAIAIWIGSLGLFVASLRSLAVLFMLPDGENEPAADSLNLFSQARGIAIGAGVMLIVIGGILPNWIIPIVRLLPLAFDHLRP